MIKVILLLSSILVVAVICWVLVLQYTQTSFYRGPRSAHFDGKQFHNLQPYKIKKFSDTLRWQWHAHKTAWPTHVANTAQPDLAAVKKSEIKVTFINHASVLIQTEKLNFLTDPIWSLRTSPLTWLGPKRVREPGVAFAALPRIDIVLISHNHYDHLDIPTLKRLAAAFHPLFIVPLGNKNLLQRYGINNIVELDWWQVYRADDVVITLLPTQHWSARGLNDKFATLWGSYGINVVGRKIYFAGDTGYSKNFESIKQQWGEPDLAFLPIGAYQPEWFMHENHMNPKEALQAHQDLNAKQSVGIHFGTFQLSDEGIHQPVDDLNKALVENPRLREAFVVLQVGESRIF